MQKIETIQDFYRTLPENRQLFLPIETSAVGHFNVFPRWRCSGAYLRRDFYKVVLVVGTGILYYADKKFVIDRPALFFTNPLVPYSWQPVSDQQDGWLCLFTEKFIQTDNLSTAEDAYPVLHANADPVFYLNDEAFEEISCLFEKMLHEMSSDYIYKYSMIRSYLQLLIHRAQKLHPKVGLSNQQTSAVYRTTFQFLELLEQQFPVSSPDVPLSIRTVRDFADKLSIHANHLNHSVKEVTSKTSSQIISGRIMREAEALLINTDWDVSEIAYALGFEYPSHFSNFFRKNGKFSPKEFRNNII